MKKVTVLASLFWLCLTSALAGDGFKAVRDRVVEHTLDNGLKFIILPRRETPVFSFVIKVDAGAVDDPQGQSGMAHMFEHMAFKGTSRIGTTDIEAERAAMEKVDQAFQAMKTERNKHSLADPDKMKELEAALKKAQEEAVKYVKTNEFIKILERFGGVGVNAGTGADHTTYLYSLPSNKLELWMSLESDRFVDPVMREFYTESDVVKEERRMRTESQPFGKLIEEFLGVAYKAHHYGVTGVGHMSDLHAITRPQAQVFYETYYVPSNMVVSLVGDVDPDQVIKLAEVYFGRMKPAPKPERIETIEPEQTAERMVTVYGSAQNITLAGYHIPDARHSDMPTYQVLSSLLSGGRTSRLYKSLVEEQKIAQFAGGFQGFPGTKYPSLFIFFSFPTQGNSNQKVLDAMMDEVEKLKTELVPEEELNKVKVQQRARQLRGLTSNSGLANALASAQLLQGDWRALFDSLDKIEAVTPEDIQRVVKQTFVDRNRTVGFYEPEQGGGK